VAEDADIILITSQAWCDNFAEMLFDITKAYAPYFIEKRRRIYDRKTKKAQFETVRHRKLIKFDDPQTAAKKFVYAHQAIPASIGRALLKELEVKRGGRHTNLKQWANDRANAYSCFLAMEHLLSTEKTSQIAAAERIGKLRGRSQEAVLRAWKKIRSEA
jgi:hypothetical protein